MIDTLQIIATLFSVLSIVIEILSIIVRHFVNITEKRVEKTLLRFRVVLKDDEERLYTLIKDGTTIKKVVLDTNKNIITHTTSTKNLHTKKTKLANNAESLVYNCAVNSLSKATKKKTSHAKVTQDVDLIMQLLKKKANVNAFTYCTLIISLILEFLLGALNPLFFNSIVVIFTGTLIILAFTNQYILKYRVKKGLFGTNYFEAKEIIAFILREQNKNKPGSGKTQLVFPEAEIEQNVLLNRDGSEELAK